MSVTEETIPHPESPSYEWREGTTEAPERFLGDYILALGLNLEDFKGRVLDLGSGALQYFNASLKSKGLDVDIVSVNPDMKGNSFREELVTSEGFENKTVAAIGQQLPFADESFDRVLSMGALTNYAGPNNVPKESVQAWMKDVVRVLKPGGVARLGVVYGTSELGAYNSYFEEAHTEGTLVTEEVVNLEGEPIFTEEDQPRQMFRVVISKPDNSVTSPYTSETQEA